jgi:hypothetical protein
LLSTPGWIALANWGSMTAPRWVRTEAQPISMIATERATGSLKSATFMTMFKPFGCARRRFNIAGLACPV